MPKQDVLQALAQNRIGKENAAKEFSRTSLLQRTWPRLRSIAALVILSWTIPISLFGCILLCMRHMLRGGNLIGIGKVASGRARNKRFHKTVIVAGEGSFCMHWYCFALLTLLIGHFNDVTTAILMLQHSTAQFSYSLTQVLRMSCAHCGTQQIFTRTT